MVRVPKEKKNLREIRNERKIGVMVYLDPWQVDAFREHEELKNKRSAMVRNILGNYLENDGYNEVDLERQKQIHVDKRRKEDLVIATIEAKQQEIRQRKTLEREGQLEQTAQDLVVTRTLYNWAKNFHLIDYKAQFDPDEQPLADAQCFKWLKADMKGDPLFEGWTPKEALNRINELREKEGDKWIEECKTRP